MDVILHVGAGKTGTSAIQAALAQHRAALFAVGLAYPESDDLAYRHAATGAISSGNGTLLARLVLPERRMRDFSAAAITGWIDRSLAEAAGRPVLWSCEWLQSAPAPAIAELDQLFAGRGARMRVIFYVRHLAEHSVARFAQLVKTGRLAQMPAGKRSLDRWLASHRSPSLNHLAAYAEVLGKDRVTCRLYDADRAQLVERFLEAITPGLGGAVPSEARQRIMNRSPTAIELPFLMALNEAPDPTAALRAATNALLNAPPLVEAPIYLSAASFAAFSARNADVVKGINARFLPPATPLRISGGSVLIGDPPPIAPGDVARVAAIAFARCQRQFAKGYELPAAAELEKTKIEAEALRAECETLRAMLAMKESECVALTESTKRWFDAVIAITPDHNPLAKGANGYNPARRRTRWWRGRHSPQPRKILADRARETGNWELAARYYRDALDEEPPNPEIWARLGDMLKSTGKVSEGEFIDQILHEIIGRGRLG